MMFQIEIMNLDNKNYRFWFSKFEIDSRKLFLNLILLAWLKRFGIGILDSKIWYADELDFWSKVI